MIERGFNKFYWGFIFIMLSFKIQGFDILPDIVGYLFLASGFSDLASKSAYFDTAAKYNIPMIILSIFSIYQAPAQPGVINFGPLGLFMIPVMIAGFVLDLLVIYNLFAGVREMADKAEIYEMGYESDKRWNSYLTLKVASLLVFIFIVIPPLALIYIIGLIVATIIILIHIAGFMKRCAERFIILE
jgi:hypothetical protein